MRRLQLFLCLLIILTHQWSAAADENLNAPRTETFTYQTETGETVTVTRDVGPSPDPTAPRTAAVEKKEQEPQPAPANLQTQKIATFQINVSKWRQLAAQVSARYPSEALEDLVLFEVMSGFAGEASTDEPERQTARWNISLTDPACEGFMHFAIPTTDEALEDFADAEEIQPGVFFEDGMTSLKTDRHIAMLASSWIPGEKQIAELRQLLREMGENRIQEVSSVKISPQKIGRSFLKHNIAGIRARLLTEAQKRDDDDELTALFRSVSFRSLADLYDAFFKETEELEYALRHDPSDQSMTIDLTTEAAKNSKLLKHYGKTASCRNRAISYLHPDQIAFCATALPLTPELSRTLPELIALGTKSLFDELGIDESPVASIQQALQESAKEGQLDSLLQIVPTQDDGVAFVAVFPLKSASAVEGTLVQMVSALEGEAGMKANVGEINGFPLHEFLRPNTDLGDEFPPDFRSYVVVTDNCIAWMLGRETDLTMLEKIVKRDLPECPAAQRFHRSAFAAAASVQAVNRVPALQKSLPELLSNFWLSDLVEAAAAKPKDDAEVSGPGQIELSLSIAQRQLRLSTRFDKDTFIHGIGVYGASLEILVGIYELVNEEHTK